jgi:hypothetical protein
MLGAIVHRSGVAVAAVLAALLALPPPVPARATAPASTAAPLVFSDADLATLSLHPTRASPGEAIARLDHGLSSRERPSVALTHVAASAGTGRGQRLEFDAFVLRSTSLARRVLSAWRRVHHAAHAKVGGGAEFLSGSRRRRTAELLFRAGDRLGLVTLTLTRRASTAGQRAIAYAQLAGSHLSASQPATGWGRLVEQVRPNGSVSETTALEAVALTYGPLPGVKPPAGSKLRVPSATGAAAWVLRYLPRLRPRLRRAVYRDLGLAPAGAGAHIATFGDPGFHQNASLTTAANTWASVYADGGHLAHHLSLTIVAGTTSSPLDGADADALPVDAAGALSLTGPYCRIRVAPSVASGSIPILSAVLAHEVFHCFEFDLDHDWTHQGDWLIEGMAEWAALKVDPVMSATAESWLIDYVDTPATPLFSRTYDALGFWGHADETAGSLWPKINAILNAGSDEQRFDDAGGTTAPFLTTWGSSFFLLAHGGAPWQINDPEPLPPGYGDAPVTELNMSAGPAEVEAAPYTTAQYAVEGSSFAPLLNVSIKGSARLGRTQNYTNLAGGWFCTASDTACECPPNSTGHTPPHRPLSDISPLGLSGDPGTGTSGTLTAAPLSDFCKPKNEQQSNNGSAATGGDPHLVDFDGALYNFQAAGEFTLLKSTRDNLQVQIRQQPFPRSRSVAINTAVAVRDGRAVVEIDSTSRTGVSALVDHRRLRAASTKLAGGGSLKLIHSGISLPPGTTPAKLCGVTHLAGSFLKYCEKLIAALKTGSTSAEIRWRDGTTVQVFNGVTSDNAKTWAPALTLQIHVARDRLRHLTGLLGDADVPAADEFRGRTGGHFDATDILEGDIGTSRQRHVLYGEFGAGWRISQRQSLFTYKRGKSTRSYTIRNFPSRPFDLSRAPAGKTQQAAALCQAAGVTNHGVAEDCEYDVVATGNGGFAAGEAPLQTVENHYTPPSRTKPPPLHPIDLGAGSADPHIAYDPASGGTYVVWRDASNAAVDVCTLTRGSPECNGGAGPYRLVDQLALQGGASPVYFSPQVLVEPGGEVVVLVEADGASDAANPSGYSNVGAVAWSSPAGGAAFASGDQGIDDGGTLLGSTQGTGDAPGNGAIALTDNVIGIYGNEYPFGSGFTDFSLGTPAPSATPTPDTSASYGDQLELDGNQLASIPDPDAPGEYIVVAVGADYGAPGGCPTGTVEATGYGVGIGTPAALQTQSAWGSSYFRPVSCQAFAPVLAGGGPSGGTIGLLEDEGPGLTSSGADGVFYRRFETTTNSFGPAVPVSDETTQTLDGADDLSLSQDAGGGVYAAWLDGRGWTLDYSDTAGAGWPGARPTGLAQGASDVVLAGAAGGDAWFAYDDGGHEYAAPVAFSQLAAGS